MYWGYKVMEHIDIDRAIKRERERERGRDVYACRQRVIGYVGTCYSFR